MEGDWEGAGGGGGVRKKHYREKKREDVEEGEVMATKRENITRFVDVPMYRLAIKRKYMMKNDVDMMVMAKRIINHCLYV